jgi:hypothetical protein
VNRTSLICGMMVSTVVMSCTVLAQQSSSASQTVTFGVLRSPQMLLRTFASVGNNLPSTSAVRHESVEQLLAATPTKITVSSTLVPLLESSQSFAAVSRVASKAMARRTVGNEASIQTDLRSIVRSNGSLPIEPATLVVTITN